MLVDIRDRPHGASYWRISQSLPLLRQVKDLPHDDGQWGFVVDLSLESLIVRAINLASDNSRFGCSAL